MGLPALSFTLMGSGVEVAGAEADAFLAQERVDPVKTCAAESAAVLSEEYQNLGLVGLKFYETIQANTEEQHPQCSDNREYAVGICQGEAIDNCHKQNDYE